VKFRVFDLPQSTNPGVLRKQLESIFDRIVECLPGIEVTQGDVARDLVDFVLRLWTNQHAARIHCDAFFASADRAFRLRSQSAGVISRAGDSSARRR